MIKNWKSEITKTHLKVHTFDPGPILSPLRKNSFPGEDKNKLRTAEIASNEFINLLEESYKN